VISREAYARNLVSGGLITSGMMYSGEHPNLEAGPLKEKRKERQQPVLMGI